VHKRAPAQAQQQHVDTKTQPPAADASDNVVYDLRSKKLKQQAERIAALEKMPRKLVGQYEVACVAFLLLFLINLVVGRTTNAGIAAAWAREFLGEGNFLERNFSKVEAGKNGGLIKEAGHCYKVYGTGRRHVEGLTVTLDLKARQDLISRIWSLVWPSEDSVIFEAVLREASTPQTVLAVGTPKAVRKIKDAYLDVVKYTKKVGGGQVSGWPGDKLHILAEHSAVFTDIFGEARVSQAFNPSGPYPRALRYFRSLYVSSESSEGTGPNKRLLRLTLALPSARNMADLAPYVALVPLLIDLFGSYRLPPDLKRKAEATRAKEGDSAEEELRKRRLEELAQRKLDKLAEEKARIARLPPAERQKAEDKLAKKQMEKQMRKRSVRVG